MVKVVRLDTANSDFKLAWKIGKTIMVVSISLSADTEQKLREVAKRRGQTLETYLEWLAATSVGDGNSPPAEEGAETWVAAWRDFVESHAANPHVADDSRESFYGDRGL